MSYAKSKKYYVYKHTNLSDGKVYIGVTGKKKPEQRWKNGDGYERNIHFYSAIKLYGWDGFSHEILRECNTIEEALKYEGDYSKKFNSTNPEYGYNYICGKDIDHFTISKETRKKVSYGLSGKARKKFSKEEKKKISDSIKESKKETSGENRFAPIECYTKDGILIGKYKNCIEAQKELGLSGTVHIYDSCRGDRKYAYGYIWKYGKGFFRRDKASKHRIEMKSIDGNFLKVYKNITELMTENNFKRKCHILDCCRGTRHSAYGYLFKYIDD